MINEELTGWQPAPVGRGRKLLEDYKMRRGMVFSAIIVAAMLAFELFNYSTTDFALTNLLGDLRFVGIRWAMILSIAFCGMDFAGIARLFTPERSRGERVEVWYLLAAWFLAATMNAMLTWWGVSLALLQHTGLGNEILGRDVLLSVVPVFVAVMVWLIRILLIGMLSMAGERLFHHVEDAVRGADERELIIEPDREPELAVAAAAAHLPTAVWRGSGNSVPSNGGQRVPTGPLGPSGPLPSQTRPARVIGTPDDDGPAERRPTTVAERHGYGRQGQPPARPPAPPASSFNTRPVPKPAVNPPPRPVVARVNPDGRTLEHNPVRSNGGNGNGHSNGGNGNGNGHTAIPSRSFDPDLDD
jgi:hypothetical protein